MKEWYSAKELAEMGLPSLPTKIRGIQKRAIKEKWQSRDKVGRGGTGKEFYYKSLPLPAQNELLVRFASEPLGNRGEPFISEQGLEPVANDTPLEAEENSLKAWQRSTMNARFSIVMHLKVMVTKKNLSKSIREFLRMAEEGMLPAHLNQTLVIAHAQSGGTKRKPLSRGTLERWYYAFKKEGRIGLAPKAREKYKTPEWAEELLRRYRQPQKPPLAMIVNDMKKAGVEIHYSAAYHYIKRLPKIISEKGRRGRKAMREILPYTKRLTDMFTINDIWVADGHCFDGEIENPFTGKMFRPEVVTFMDIKTRRIVGMNVWLSESAFCTIGALKNGVERYGIPAVIYTDNGSGYCNAMLGEMGVGILDRLGITHKTILPGNSQANGAKERHHQELVKAAKRLPTFIGKDMDSDASHLMFKLSRKNNASSIVPFKEFVSWLEGTIEEYNNTPQGHLERIRKNGVKTHLTPAEAWEVELDKGYLPTYLEEGMNDMFFPSAMRTCRRGLVRIMNEDYSHPQLQYYHGEQVIVRTDPLNAEQVWVRDADERLICIAKRNGHAKPFLPVSLVEKARWKRFEQQKKRLELKAENLQVIEEDEGMHARGYRQDDVSCQPQRIIETIEGQVKIKSLPPAKKEAAKVSRLPAKPKYFQNDSEKYNYLAALSEQGKTTAEEEAWMDAHVERLTTRKITKRRIV